MCVCVCVCVCVLFIYATTFNLTKHICSFFRKEQRSSSIGLTCGRTDKENDLFVSYWKDALKPSSSEFSVPNFWLDLHTRTTLSQTNNLLSIYIFIISGLPGIAWQNQSPSLEWTSQLCCPAFCLSTSCPSSVLETSTLQHRCAGRAGKKRISTNVPLIY